MTVIKFDPDTFGITLFAQLENQGVKRRMKMVLDTGATYTIIPWYIAEELGYKPGISKDWVSITTATSVINAPLITISSMEVLGRKISNVEAVCHNLPESSRVDGLLGLSYLKNFKLTLDFKNGILELE